jgi:hypothetical protein
VTDLAAGGTRTATTTHGYDSIGRVIHKTDSGDGVPDLCTSTAYADNTTSWIRDHISETITSPQVCPAPGVTPAPILADVRTYFDSQTTLGSISGAGDPTRTDTATVNTGGNLTFATTAQATLDVSGRQISMTDANSNTTTLAYTPADGGNLTQTVTTNPLNQTSATVVEPGRGKTTATIDIAGHRTDGVYDALGRLTADWLPGHNMAAGAPASATYVYQLSPSTQTAVTTNSLVHTGLSDTYVTSIKIYDALGQLKQTQSSAEGGGRAVSDTRLRLHPRLVAGGHRLSGPAGPYPILVPAGGAPSRKTNSRWLWAGRLTMSMATASS